MESDFIEKRMWRSLETDITKSTKRRRDTCKGLEACRSWLLVSGFIPNLCLFLDAAAMIGVDLS